MKQRDTYVDVAKGLAMLLIVRIHTECASEIGIPYPIIAVPFFFFLSGFYDHSEKPINKWISKAFMSLIFTTILWNCFGIVLHFILETIKTRSLTAYSFEGTLYEPCFGNRVTWFLVALFYAKILTWLISLFTSRFNLSNNIQFFILLPFTFLIGLTSSLANLPLLLDEGMAALPFYYTGKIIYPYIKKIIKNKLLVVCGIISICMMPFNWFPCVMVPVWEKMNWGIALLIYGMILMSFVPFLFVSAKLTSVKLLEKFGQVTLGVLVLHPFMLHIVAITLNRVFTKGSLIWEVVFVFAYFVVVILCYYLTIWINRHCPILLGAKIKSAKNITPPR